MNPHERSVLVRVGSIEVVLNALRRTYAHTPLRTGSSDDLEGAIGLLQDMIAQGRPRPGEPSCVHDGFIDTSAKN